MTMMQVGRARNAIEVKRAREAYRTRNVRTAMRVRSGRRGARKAGRTCVTVSGAALRDASVRVSRRIRRRAQCVRRARVARGARPRRAVAVRGADLVGCARRARAPRDAKSSARAISLVLRRSTLRSRLNVCQTATNRAAEAVRPKGPRMHESVGHSGTRGRMT